MNTEDLLRVALREHVETTAPPVHVPGLVRRGRRRRTAIMGGTTVLVAAVLVGAVVVTGALSGGVTSRGEPAPADTPGEVGAPTPVPGPTEVYELADGRLVIDGVVAPARERESMHITRNGVAYSGPGGVPYLVTMDGEDVALAPEQPQRAGADYAGWVAADPTRSLVAWTEEGPDGADFVLYDTAADREVARKSVPCKPKGGFPGGCPRAYVMSDGLVFVIDNGVRGWDPLGLTRSETEYFLIDTPEVLQAHARTVYRPSWIGDASYSGLPADWTATPPLDENGLLSFDGDWALSGLTVTSVDHPDQSMEVDPPGEPVESQFDPDGSLLVVTHVDGGYQVVDCALDGSADCTPVSEVEDKPMRLILTDT